jgi:hypothetical protein
MNAETLKAAVEYLTAADVPCLERLALRQTDRMLSGIIGPTTYANAYALIVERLTAIDPAEAKRIDRLVDQRQVDYHLNRQAARQAELAMLVQHVAPPDMALSIPIWKGKPFWLTVDQRASRNVPLLTPQPAHALRA